MFSNELSTAEDLLNDARTKFDEILEKVEDAGIEADEDFDALDDVATTIYGIDADVFDGSLLTKDEIHDAIVAARNVAENRRDEFYSLEDEVSSVITAIDEAIDKADYI